MKLTGLDQNAREATLTFADGTRVHAIVELAAAGGLDEDELRAHCHARLAAHEVPRSIEIVDTVPRETMGKLQRTRLAEHHTHAVA